MTRSPQYFLDLTKTKESLFKDIILSEKYFSDLKTLYYSLVNYGGRKVNVKKVSKLSVIK